VDDPFEILGVDSDADDADIDEAYRRRVMETHPDQGGSVRSFQRVKDAYERILAMENAEAGDADPTTPRRPITTTTPGPASST